MSGSSVTAVLMSKIIVERASALAREQALENSPRLVGLYAGQLSRWTDEIVADYGATVADVKRLIELGTQCGKLQALARTEDKADRARLLKEIREKYR